uniref:Uncharacterized protein n=1 Tax=Desulfatirhabdium butyrativorans TaxID=340467 RepID=A0A7C4RUF2_9BACT
MGIKIDRKTLPTAYCPLPTAHCLLPTADCRLPMHFGTSLDLAFPLVYKKPSFEIVRPWPRG